MPQPYMGEIRMFAGNYPPAGWEFCEGQLLPISENDALFVVLGTTYGGDGESTFALPDLRGRIPIHQGSVHTIAEAGGVEQVTLTTQQIPVHNHAFLASLDPASSLNAKDNMIGTPATATPFYASTPNVALTAQSISPVGGSQPHTNFAPYLCVNFIISLFGLFPSQT